VAAAPAVADSTSEAPESAGSSRLSTYAVRCPSIDPLGALSAERTADETAGGRPVMRNLHLDGRGVGADQYRLRLGRAQTIPETWGPAQVHTGATTGERLNPAVDSLGAA
jgi:hypothetical protein